MNSTTLTILIVAAILLIIVSLTDLIADKNKKKNSVPKNNVLPLSYDEALGILNQVIIESIEERKFMLKFNEKATVPPLDEEMSYMTNRIFDSLSDDLIINLNRYVTIIFLTRYINRTVREFCMQYIEEVRFDKKN